MIIIFRTARWVAVYRDPARGPEEHEMTLTLPVR